MVLKVNDDFLHLLFQCFVLACLLLTVNHCLTRGASVGLKISLNDNEDNNDNNSYYYIYDVAFVKSVFTCCMVDYRIDLNLALLTDIIYLLCLLTQLGEKNKKE